jgi:hypothetical protein
MADELENIINIYSRVGLPFPLGGYHPSVPFLGAAQGVVDSFKSVKPSMVGDLFNPEVEMVNGVEATPAMPEFGQVESQSGLEEIMPVFLTMVLKGGATQKVRMWPEVMVSCKANLDIKADKADRAKYRGTVKQGAVRDYSLELRGHVMHQADTDTYPMDELVRLRNMFERSVSLKITCKLARAMNINEVVFHNLALAPVEGGMGAYSFAISLLSDDPYPYTVLKG